MIPLLKNKYFFLVSFINLSLFFPMLLAAWEGYRWEEWLRISKENAPEIRTDQNGQKNLVPLLRKPAAPNEEISSIKEWENKREAILQTLRTMLGEPNDLQSIPPYAEILDEMDLGGYWRKHLRIACERDDWISAYLLIPKPIPTRPSPTMIVIHQTVSQGKDEPCGISGDPEMAIALELVNRGYPCLVPDMIGFGERIPPGTSPYHDSQAFFLKHPHWSFMGKMVWDVQRLIDFLITLPFVDSYRIGCIGHSHGAYATIFATIFEPRISAAIASCGFTPLRRDEQPERWSHLTPLIPRLGFYLSDVNEMPFDWHEILACLAPRSFFNWSVLDDAIFPHTDSLHSIYQQLEVVYSLYGAKDHLHALLEPGNHAFPKSIRDSAYRWLRTALPPRPDLHAWRQTLSYSQEEWESQREQIRDVLLEDIGNIEPDAKLASYTILGSTPQEGYIEEKIQYGETDADAISAYLLRPDTGKEKYPGMIVFHQTTAEGKEESVGHRGRSSLHFGPELARRGYIVLAPDSITAGERVGRDSAFDTREFYRRYPCKASALGKMIQDGRMAIDIMQSVPNIALDRIGVIGHSLGAEEALFVAAFDTRVQAAVASCGFAPFRTEKDPGRWARDEWFSYLPRLRIDLRAGRLPSWDFDDAIRLIAPRGFFHYQTTEDEIFPEADAAHALTLSTRSIWILDHAETRLQSRLESGPHDISLSAKTEIYPWLDKILQP